MNAPELSDDASRQVSKLDARYAELLNKHYADRFLEHVSNEAAAVELLVSWSEFTRSLKAGEVAMSELAIQKAVGLKPKTIAPEYHPLWQSVGNWHALFTAEEAKYYEHLDKGNSLADRGRNAAAIREFQAAYDIIQNPSIAERIKKLNEQSLGL